MTRPMNTLTIVLAFLGIFAALFVSLLLGIGLIVLAIIFHFAGVGDGTHEVRR